jgi:hypothetical protein
MYPCTMQRTLIALSILTASLCHAQNRAIDDANALLLEDDPASAQQVLIWALRRGEIDSSTRPQALALLAEAQLRDGNAGSAIINYRKAARLGLDAEQLRPALAMAYAAHDELQRAYREARPIAGPTCSEHYSQSECYAAEAVLAVAAPRRAERNRAEDAMLSIRDAHEEIADDLDRVDAMVFGVIGC